MRLQQAFVNSDKVQAAQSGVLSAYNRIQEGITTIQTTASKEKRDEILTNLSTWANQYKSSAEVAFPKFKGFVGGAVEQAQGFITELRNVSFTTGI